MQSSEKVVLIILEDDAVIFKVDNKKSMFYSSDKRISSIVDNLHEKNTAYCL